jgi:hypothetical protein
MCNIAIAKTIRHHITSASLFKRLSIEPFDTYYPATNNPSPEKILDFLGRKSSTSRLPTNEVGSNSEKGTPE